MKWKGRRESSQVDDRRGVSGGKIAAGGGLVAIVVIVLNLLMGGELDLSPLSQRSPNIPGQTQEMSPEEIALDEERAAFVRVVLADTEDVWNKLFSAEGRTYELPTLVMFRNQVQSACGMAGSASGPFYCPGDQKMYIDLSFFQEMAEKLKAPGELAMAYVIAHEVGHHIQFLNGTTQKMARLRQSLPEEEYNKYSVRLELQADFLAGVWVHHADKMKNMLEEQDLASALNAAYAIGDDRLQKMGQGYVVPESFTHGSSEQRMFWFKKGYETGDPNQSIQVFP
jgi:predicted metalloprotease